MRPYVGRHERRLSSETDHTEIARRASERIQQTNYRGRHEA